MKASRKIILALIFIIILIAIGVGGYLLIKISKDSNEKISSLENQVELLKNEEQDTDMQNKNEVGSDIKKDNDSASKNEYNSNKKSEAEVANEAIRTVLKDKQWVEKNIIGENERLEYGEQSVSLALESIVFVKMPNTTNYIVYHNGQGGQAEVLSIITYENGKVMVTMLLEKEYSFYKIDAKNMAVCVVHSVAGRSCYKIDGKKVTKFAYVDGEEGAEETKYFFENNECTEKEFDEKLEKYNFEEMKIKLTNENIDKYVK